jgi:hypothetical protein
VSEDHTTEEEEEEEEVHRHLLLPTGLGKRSIPRVLSPYSSPSAAHRKCEGAVRAQLEGGERLPPASSSSAASLKNIDHVFSPDATCFFFFFFLTTTDSPATTIIITRRQWTPLA